MKNLLLLTALLFGSTLFAQSTHFTSLPNKQLPDQGRHRLERTDNAHLSELINAKALYLDLAAAPHERDASAKAGRIVELPGPGGKAVAFRIVRYDLLSPSAQELLPEFVSAYGEDTAGKGMRISLTYTPHGLNASVRGGDDRGRWLIDPVFTGDARYVQSFYVADAPAVVERECLVEDDVRNNIDRGEPIASDKIIDDCRLRTHELALACTGEYFQYMVANYGGSGNDYATVLSRMAVTLDRVNGIFREDLAIVFTLVNQMQADTVQLLFNDPATDPYDNFDTNQLTDVNTGVTDGVIGVGNYDLGHVFSTSFGGLAGPGICFEGRTAVGATGLPAPETDVFDVDFVAHELGHQLGANHTFNTITGSCSGSNRNAATAHEPGSASSIMGYAGICSPNNIQPNTDAYFSIISQQEINSEMQQVFSNYDPGSCAVYSTGNISPTVEAGVNHIVPLNTPFFLSATGNDPDGGTLTYCWEQYFNSGTTITQVSPEPNGSETNAPLFRSRPPVTDPVRYFPQLAGIGDNLATGDWETLPTVAQTLQFRVTVRDGISNGGYGCPQSDQMEVQFVDTGDQYGVTLPNGGETYQTGSTQTITWNKAGTDSAPINCGTVDILFSTDGGMTYPTTLASGVANDGAEDVTLPTTSTATARVMVRCATGIFFDVSDADFAIEETEFTYAGNQASTSICAKDDEATFTVDVTSTQGYTGSVDLSVTGGLPPGATATWSTNPVVFTAGNANTTQTITLTISSLAAVAEGDYTITTQADDGAETKTVDLMLSIGSGPITLTAPEDGSEQLMGQGAGGTNELTFSTITVPGYRRYRVSYQVIRASSNVGNGNFSVIFGSDPGTTPVDITNDLASFIQPEDEIVWTITASDPNGVLTDVVSCSRSFIFRTVLPVTWLEFTAGPVGKSARLNWIVVQDGLNAGFGIERSPTERNSWRQIGYLTTNGINGQTRYHYTDETVAAGNAYNYRLRQEDADGQRSFSEIRTVAFGADAGLALRPNPAGDFALMSVGGAPENLWYELYNSLGQQLNTGTVTGGFARIDLRVLPTAVYQVVVSDGSGYREVARLVKK